MGTRLVPPETAALLGALVALLAVSFSAVAAPAPVVVGSIKCLDCSPDDVKAEDAFRGLQVGIMCNSGAGEAYETKMLGNLDENGSFSIPLEADLLRNDGELGKDCFAQLHTAPETPCAGQTPPRIAKAGPENGTTTTDADAAPTYLAVSDDTVFSPVACKCGKYKKKHFMFAPPPPPPRPPAPEYKPPTPTPTPTPEPSYGPPTPKPPAPPVEDEPEPFFHKHPKLKFMHKKKPCPPLVDEEIPRPKN
ncbi:hypothetical protein E2562_022162 [Oryza meyeriana var. granulata]|uniref:Proline-rich protein n=1 Tax=Oryza meyeriana var. granulata TaxID=110450 RepID=A0A6G1DLK8_9ORYZ|nr:hypothetical protein E2562_022162 [Oryza meyeriana var. granulata]